MMEQYKNKILEALGEVDGFLPLGKNSRAETIKKTLGMEKLHFQQAVMELVDEGRVELIKGGVRAVATAPASGRMFRQVRRKRR